MNVRTLCRLALLGTVALSGPILVGGALRAKQIGHTLTALKASIEEPSYEITARRSSGLFRSTAPAEKTVSDVLGAIASEVDPPARKAPSTPSRLASPRLNQAQMGELARRCAPSTPVSVIVSLIGVESGGHPLVLGQNRPRRTRYWPVSRNAAAVQLTALEASGASVDVGLMQINTATLKRLHVPAAAALDACRNVAIGAQVFDDGYAAAFHRHQATLPLLSAYSAYNTGDVERGVRNGYADQAISRLRTPSPPSKVGWDDARG